MVQVSCPLENPLTDLTGQGADLAIALGVGAAQEHLFYGPFGHQLGFAGLVPHHHTHAAALKVKGDLVHFGVLLPQSLGPQLLLLGNDRQVDEVFQAGLKGAVQKGMAQDPRVFLSVDVEVVFQHHLVLGEGAGFVSAEDVHGAQVLHGVELFDDDLLPAHGHGAPGQRGGNDHGQHLRCQAHGDRESKEHRLGPVSLGKAVEQQHHRGHEQHKADEHPGDFVHALFKGGFGGALV